MTISTTHAKMLSNIIAEELRKDEALHARIVGYATHLLSYKTSDITPESSIDDILDMLDTDFNVNLVNMGCKIKLTCAGKNGKVKITWTAPWINDAKPFVLEVSGTNPQDALYACLDAIIAAPRGYTVEIIGGAVLQELADAIHNIIVDKNRVQEPPQEPDKEKVVKKEPTEDEIKFQTILDSLRVESIDDLRKLVESDMNELGEWDEIEEEYLYEIPMVIRIKGSRKEGLLSAALEREGDWDDDDIDDCFDCCPVCGHTSDYDADEDLEDSGL